MTTINITLLAPTDTGVIPAVGKVEFTPTARTVLPEGTVLPSSFEVELDINGEAVVELTPTTPYFVWRVREYVHGGGNYFVAVPDSDTPLLLSALTIIDPTTLTPEAQAQAWDSLELRVEDLESYVANTQQPIAVRYTPTLTATGLSYTGTGTTEPTYDSYYVKIGKLVSFSIKVNLTTVTNFGTGQIKLNNGLPFPAILGVSNHFAAWAWVNPALPADDLNGHIQIVADHLPNNTTLDLHWLKASASNPKPVIESLLEQSLPVTLTTNSIIYINGTYITN